MAVKRYFHPFGRHSEQLITPTTTVIDGQTIFTPGLSAEFSNHICTTEDPKLQKAIENTAAFKRGTIKLMPEQAPVENSGPDYGGKATVVEGKGAGAKKKG
jgi:hypothetical protein